MSLSKLFSQEIRQHYLFRHLSDQALENVLEKSYLANFDKNESVFCHGDQATHFYLVRKGQISLYQSSPDGNEKIVELIPAGEAFAEAVMFMSGHRLPVNARATMPTELFCIESSSFVDELSQSTKLCFALMADMSKRLKGLMQEISELTIFNARHRLISYLLGQFSDQHNQPTIKLTATKSMIASRLSITPETFSRLLSQLKKEGLISLDEETVTLEQPERLKALIGEI